jgi:hypothetical protein
MSTNGTSYPLCIVHCELCIDHGFSHYTRHTWGVNVKQVEEGMEFC